MNPFQYPYMMTLPITPLDERPPTLYRLMNSLANYDKEDKTKIQDLASVTHSTIFNFNYPLSKNINKDEFEIMILNKFIMRRINFETFTAFQIALNVKINEIMPIYNKLFDSLEGWDLFNTGEEIKRIRTDDRNINSTNTITGTGNTTDDNRYSNLPQSQIDNVRDAKYLTDYTYNQGTTNTSTNGSANSNDKLDVNEVITRSPQDKIRIYKEFLDSRNSIYTMIFNDLDILFYQLI